MISHIRGLHGPSMIISIFIPCTNGDLGINCVIDAIYKATTRAMFYVVYIYCFLTITHCGFKSFPYFSMCWTTYPHTCSIRVAGSRYCSSKPAGPATRITLLLHCITCYVLYQNAPFTHVIHVSNLQSILPFYND